MDSVQIEQFLVRLGCTGIYTGGTGWVSARCPLAVHRSDSGMGRSFRVRVEPGGTSGYRCLACGTQGKLIDLVEKLGRKQRLDSKSTQKLIDYLIMNNEPSAEQRKYRQDRLESIDYQRGKTKLAGIEVSKDLLPRTASATETLIPEETLDKMRELPTEVFDYLTGPERRLAPASIRLWELGWHPGTTRISIPIRDLEGRLVGISGRAFRATQKPKYLHSSGFRGSMYLYGENLAAKGGTVHLSEGFFDVIYLRQKGYNALGMHGSHLSRMQIEKLKRFWDRVVIVPDGDEAGREAAVKAKEQLDTAMRLPTTVIDMPDDTDPDQLSDEYLYESLGPCQF